MRITDKQFVQIIQEHSQDINTTINQLESCAKLLKIYGRNIFSNSYSAAISKESSDIMELLQALKAANKADVKTITTIIRLLKEYAKKQYNAEFEVHVNTQVDTAPILSFLQTQDTKAQIYTDTTDDVEVLIK